MMCHRIGRVPIGTMGLGLSSVSSRMRVPRPPQRTKTGMSEVLVKTTHPYFTSRLYRNHYLRQSVRFVWTEQETHLQRPLTMLGLAVIKPKFEYQKWRPLRQMRLPIRCSLVDR